MLAAEDLKGAASSGAEKPRPFTLISQYFGNSNRKLPSAILPLTCPVVYHAILHKELRGCFLG
jgi:hypothetical protein